MTLLAYFDSFAESPRIILMVFGRLGIFGTWLPVGGVRGGLPPVRGAQMASDPVYGVTEPDVATIPLGTFSKGTYLYLWPYWLHGRLRAWSQAWQLACQACPRSGVQSWECRLTATGMPDLSSAGKP